MYSILNFGIIKKIVLLQLMRYLENSFSFYICGRINSQKYMEAVRKRDFTSFSSFWEYEIFLTITICAIMALPHLGKYYNFAKV